MIFSPLSPANAETYDHTQQNITLDEGNIITLQCEVKFTEADEVWRFWLFNRRRPSKNNACTKGTW